MSFAYSLFHNSVGRSVGRSLCSSSWNWFSTMTASLMRMLIVNYSLHRASNWTQLDVQHHMIKYIASLIVWPSVSMFPKEALSFAFNSILTGPTSSMIILNCWLISGIVSVFEHFQIFPVDRLFSKCLATCNIYRKREKLNG